MVSWKMHSENFHCVKGYDTKLEQTTEPKTREMLKGNNLGTYI